MQKQTLCSLLLTSVVTFNIAQTCLAEMSKELTRDEQTACKSLGLDPADIAKLAEKPLYKFTEAEVDKYLKFLSATEPDLRKRIVHLAQKHRPTV